MRHQNIWTRGGGSPVSTPGWNTTCCSCSIPSASAHFLGHIFGCFPPPHPLLIIRLSSRASSAKGVTLAVRATVAFWCPRSSPFCSCPCFRGEVAWLGWPCLTKQLQAPWHKGVVCFNSLPSFGRAPYTKKCQAPPPDSRPDSQSPWSYSKNVSDWFYKQGVTSPP
jgi:hypothetical protein